MNKILELFGREYFENSNISNYVDYKTKKYDKLANELYNWLELEGTYILDFGCGPGLLIKELIKKPCTIYGTDISEWAINFGKDAYPEISDNLFNYNRQLLYLSIWDYVFFLDVLEHMDDSDLKEVMRLLSTHTELQVLVRIPVANQKTGKFVYDVSNNDKSHVQCRTKKWWEELFKQYGFRLDMYLDGEKAYDSEGVLVAVFKKD